ncbi:unnamed protein product [Brachionus calyciflorus]|uniref:Uncharacterized protein n=1 Tax=Brachionus calyciflorus TaxID=104777 RepID=A0A813R0T5_9BILA|nr:unnamed protein product [Brachionus calyciflorus]
MSSYHIVNAVWVGIFPMLAVMVIVGILFYLICCLNQIKNRIILHRKRQSLKKARLKIRNEKKSQDSKLMDSKNLECFEYAKPDRSKLALDLLNTPTIRKPSWKYANKTGSAGDLYTTQPETPIDELIVQELNESPKSAYSRMQSLTNLKKEINSENLDGSKNQPRNSDVNSYSDNDSTLNDYDSSSSDNINKIKGTIKDKIKKRNQKKRSKSSNQLKLIKYRPKILEINKLNRLSSDIDYGDDIFNDDDSLSSTGFSVPHSKSALILYKYERNNQFSTIKESETGSSLNVKKDKIKKFFPDAGSYYTLRSLRKSPIPGPINKSASLQRSIIANSSSSSMSDMDPDDSILRDILIKTPKTPLRKNVNFTNV